MSHLRLLLTWQCV